MLNPIIRGWSNYYRHCSASKSFNTVAHRIWQMTWQWSKRRHPKKSSRWVKKHYFRRIGNRGWIFATPFAILINPTTLPITRHIKVKGRNSPYDPKLRDYWTKRTRRRVSRQTYTRLRLQVLQAQEYRCWQCDILFQPDEAIDLHHIIPRASGGSNRGDNRAAIHPYCHRQVHQRHGYKVLEA